MQLFKKNTASIFSGTSENQIKIAKASQSPWIDYPLSPEQRSICFGSSRLWFYEMRDDLWISEWHGTEYDSESPEKPEDDDWHRWGLDPKYKVISLRPAYAPKPHLVVPEYPLIVAPKVKIKIYVQSPLWVQVYIQAKRRVSLIHEFPSHKLSKTWFGDTTQGEACFSLSTKAIRTIEELEHLPHFCISPITIRNASEDDLKIERICLRGNSFDLYQGDDRIWTSETIVTYRGKNKNSRIEISESTPSQVSGSVPIGKPREPHDKSFIAKTFSQIRYISQADL